MTRITALLIRDDPKVHASAYGPVDGKYGLYIGTLAESPSGSERPRTLLTSEPRFATAEEAAAAAESLIVAIRKAENEVTT